MSPDDVRLHEAVHGLVTGEDGIMENGAIVLCMNGCATITVNYKEWPTLPDSVLTLFPGDIVSVSCSDDFAADILTYSPAVLREASLDIEHAVYDTLREDRCRGAASKAALIVVKMFDLLKVYAGIQSPECFHSLVLCQLKAFFIGFHDYLRRFPDQNPPLEGSIRKRRLFNDFMSMLEHDYRRNRNLGFYAEKLNITPKYLNIIVKSITGHTAKELIDHYVVLKIKQDLRHSNSPVKQLAWDYNFCDASFFTRYFRQHTGMTPHTWRLEGQ